MKPTAHKTTWMVWTDVDVKPTAHKTTWMVWTDGQIYGGGGLMGQAPWRWVVTGPLGSEAGVAETSDEATQRAYGAAMLLSSGQEQKT